MTEKSLNRHWPGVGWNRLLGGVVLCLCGCSQTPRDVVIDSSSMVVYEVRNHADKRVGSREYFIRDGSTKGWRLITDRELEVGDIVRIEKTTAEK